MYISPCFAFALYVLAHLVSQKMLTLELNVYANSVEIPTREYHTRLNSSTCTRSFEHYTTLMSSDIQLRTTHEDAYVQCVSSPTCNNAQYDVTLSAQQITSWSNLRGPHVTPSYLLDAHRYIQSDGSINIHQAGTYLVYAQVWRQLPLIHAFYNTSARRMLYVFKYKQRSHN